MEAVWTSEIMIPRDMEGGVDGVDLLTMHM